MNQGVCGRERSIFVAIAVEPSRFLRYSHLDLAIDLQIRTANLGRLDAGCSDGSEKMRY